MSEGGVLQAKVLGRPGFTVAGEGLEPPSPKLFAVLCHLAVRRGKVERGELAELFWGAKGMNGLRIALHRLKGLPGYGAALHVDDEGVSLEAESDLARFEAAVRESRHGDALDVWRDARIAGKSEGALLEGVAPRGIPAFAEWLEVERSRVQALYLDSLRAYAGQLEQRGELREALAVARRLVAEDLLNEEAHRAVMRLCWQSGEPEAALAQFESCRRVLAEELGLTPLAETEALYARIVASRQLGRARGKASRQAEMPFVGRRDELRVLLELLEGHRLVTVTGFGGVGKTRLALQAGERFAPRLMGGVAVVPLAPLAHPGLLATAVADAVGGEALPHGRLFERLKERSLLLILDNFEHLLAGRAFVDELLRACPGVRVLVTSRVRLALPEEQELPLTGLCYPESVEDVRAPQQAAVRFFTLCARRVRADFALTREARGQVVRLCQLVDGLPLALELAASWLQDQPLGEVLSDLERNLRALDERGSPEGRSLRAVFEHSWQRLTPSEREGFARLALFRGGFDREAAEAVAQAPLSQLLVFVSKSLLARNQAGRFEMLEVVRQFAQEKLEPSKAHLAVASRHAEHYLGRFAREAEHLTALKADEAIARIAPELHNIHHAWCFAAASKARDRVLLERVLEGMHRFVYRTSRFATAVTFLQDALGRSCDAGDPLRPRLLVRLGACLTYLGRFEDAEAALREALSAAALPPEDAALAYTHLGRVHYYRGEIEVAGEAYQRSLAGYRALAHAAGMAGAYTGLATVASSRRQPGRTRHLLLRALACSRRTSDHQGAALALINLAALAQRQQDAAAAVRYATGAHALFDALGSELGLAQAEVRLSTAESTAGNAARAGVLAERALSRYRRLGDLQGEVVARRAYAQALALQGHLARAGDELGRAYAGARAVQNEVFACRVALERARLEGGQSGKVAREHVATALVHARRVASPTTREALAAEIMAALPHEVRRRVADAGVDGAKRLAALAAALA